MSFNIVDLVKEQLNGQVVGYLGNLLGGDAEHSASAINAAIPAVLHSLTEAGASHSGAKTMFDMVNKQDDSILDNLGDLLGSGSEQRLVESGTSALSSLLGENGFGSLTDALSSFSGAKREGVASMLGLFTPMIFSLLKRKLSAMPDGENAGAMMNLLHDQKKHIDTAMPQGFIEKLDLKSVKNQPEEVKETVEEMVYEEEEKKHGVSWMAWLVMALLAGAGYYAYTMYQEAESYKPREKVSTPVEVEKTAKSPEAKEVEVPIKEEADISKVQPTEKMGLEELSKNVTKTMASLEKSFSSITDRDSAIAALDDITVSTENMGAYADMLDKLPAGGKANIINIVTNALPSVENAINKVGSIPGVGGVLRPIVMTLLENLAKFR
jgi:hypothetical protein